MADNTALNLGVGGDTLSTDDVGSGVKVQRVKVQHGADGSATDVSSASGLPVDLGYTVAGATPLYQAIDLGASGALVAAHATQKIKLLALYVIGNADDTTTLILNDGSGGTALTGTLVVANPAGVLLPYNPAGWCVTSAATALYATLGGTANLDGLAVYINVT